MVRLDKKKNGNPNDNTRSAAMLASKICFDKCNKREHIPKERTAVTTEEINKNIADA